MTENNDKQVIDLSSGISSEILPVEMNPLETDDPLAESLLMNDLFPNQPWLNRMITILGESAGENAIGEAYINEADGKRPYLVVAPDCWPAVAVQLRDHEELQLKYLRSIAGIDYETHMETVYYLISLETKNEVCVKVKTDREHPSIPSITPVWQTANWNEREIYDLFGIDFPGHPDLRRIMMPDDWIGHPMRKDYEPLDSEV